MVWSTSLFFSISKLNSILAFVSFLAQRLVSKSQSEELRINYALQYLISLVKLVILAVYKKVLLKHGLLFFITEVGVAVVIVIFCSPSYTVTQPPRGILQDWLPRL